VVAETLSDLSARPGLYGDDTVVFLALRMAQARLLLDRTGESIEPVQQLLWETALRIEDGQLSLAERDLRRLQQELQEALARNAPDDEIEKLINELKEALDRYLREMAQNMERMDPRDMERVPFDPDRMVTRDDLQELLDKARELSRSGAKDAARQLLSQLQQMLENLRMAQPMQQGQGQNQAQQMMRNMREMLQRQQQLLDRSFRAQRGQQHRRRRGLADARRPGKPDDLRVSGVRRQCADDLAKPRVVVLHQRQQAGDGARLSGTRAVDQLADVQLPGHTR